MCLTRHRDVGATLLGTAFGTSWNDLTEKWKCGTGAEETDECQFPVCWLGAWNNGEWLVGPNDFDDDGCKTALRIRAEWYRSGVDKWCTRECIIKAHGDAWCLNQSCERGLP